VDRYWLLTSTTYGTWLPGDSRGFVSRVREGEGPRIEHDVPGTPCDVDIPALRESARANMTGPPIYLTSEQAPALLAQFQETAAHRGWQLLAVAIMANHVHLVVGVLGDPEPERLLKDFKSYGSRALTRGWGRPVSETWWTQSGSKRKLRDADAVRRAIIYVRDQERPLLIWLSEEAVELLASGGRQSPETRRSTTENSGD
jgi:REP element-mobilizing transposase RayT